ncbi:MAG: hypothetical protein J0G32_03755 [Alphaproteobacteria bacterium]|jgi:hypothetical protein|nr:hypothetical protein [Alphaproteobacteria bacterium]OJV12544.1 MAG: hypothetical protein BGO27_03370 [Alphaproteobacteria bacterium 33-17]
MKNYVEKKLMGIQDYTQDSVSSIQNKVFKVTDFTLTHAKNVTKSTIQNIGKSMRILSLTTKDEVLGRNVKMDYIRPSNTYKIASNIKNGNSSRNRYYGEDLKVLAIVGVSIYLTPIALSYMAPIVAPYYSTVTNYISGSSRVSSMLNFAAPMYNSASSKIKEYVPNYAISWIATELSLLKSFLMNFGAVKDLVKYVALNHTQASEYFMGYLIGRYVVDKTNYQETYFDTNSFNTLNREVLNGTYSNQEMVKVVDSKGIVSSASDKMYRYLIKPTTLFSRDRIYYTNDAINENIKAQTRNMAR